MGIDTFVSSEGLHESESVLRPETIDRHRANSSLREELEAIDWYDQRIDAASDLELAALLAHNRDEEKEHAAMVLEWLRRRDPVFDRHLRTYLFSEGSILAIEAAGEDSADQGGAQQGDLGIGGLRRKDDL